MSTLNAGFGLIPRYHPSGIIRPSCFIGGISSGFASNIWQFQPVRIDPATQLLAPVVANNVDILGSFAGVEYIDASGHYTARPWWTAGTVYSGELRAYIHSADAPFTVWEIQADGSVAAGNIGEQFNLTNFAVASSIIGNSQATVAATPVGAGNQGQLRLVAKSLDPDNDWGDAYTRLMVTIARHQYVGNKVAI